MLPFKKGAFNLAVSAQVSKAYKLVNKKNYIICNKLPIPSSSVVKHMFAESIFKSTS